MRQFAPVHVGYDFECEKKNGKVYAGEIVNVGIHNGRTLVTIRFSQEESYFDRYNQQDITIVEPAYRSIYLEDCIVWYAGEPAPY